MAAIIQNFDFTRYIYGLKYSYANTFNEFTLLHRMDYYSSLTANRYEMAQRVQIEPYKGKNSKTKGAKLYFSNWFPNDPKDETGMFPTKYSNIYFGDLKFLDVTGNQKKVLVFFQILPEDEQLIVDVFDDHYPKNKKDRNRIIDGHPWHKKSTR